jgi:hypothetical protein
MILQKNLLGYSKHTISFKCFYREEKKGVQNVIYEF